jgi:outer membrane protein TolC
MRRRLHLSALAFVAAIVSCASAASADPLRLEDAVQLALANNERAQKAPLRVEAAAGQLERARDAFLPSLTANGGATLRPTDERNTRAITSNGTLTLSQPLVNPSAFPLYAQARHSFESEKWGAAEDKRQLAFDTAKTFMSALASDRVLTAAKRKLETSKANLESAQARVQAGLASSNDVTKAELDLQTSLQQVTSAEGAVVRAFLDLGFLIGQKVDPPLIAPDQTTRAAAAYEQARGNQVKSALERRADALNRALDRRPDVRSSHERTEALKLSASEPLYRLAPSLNASGQVRAVPDPAATEKAVDESVSLNLVWNIFDAGIR